MKSVERVLQEPVNLGIVVQIAGQGGKAAFLDVFRQHESEIKHQGNLTARSRRMEDAGIIAIEKVFVDRRPRTWLILTDAGWKALAKYKRTLTNTIEALTGAGA
ncbi:Winged helix DNA-binding domain-containing protein [Bradyrhizobium erythrophlei]|jgi:hypothetical protein|nr:Winged helix DNA-binding domain-containing protein [Bradyrhizobium erythrophlei]